MAFRPKFLFVQVNKRCNLRCTHCYFWQRDDADSAEYLSSRRRKDILGEFASLNPTGKVVICGGEPMLDLDDYFGFTRDCMALGLRSLSVVNGTRIRSPQMADRMVREGPDEISISLDSHRPELHDEVRGVPGAFDKAVRALKLLLEARVRHPERRTRIYVMGLVFDKTYEDLEGFYDFVLNRLGADKLKLNFLQPAFGQEGPTDPFFAGHVKLDPEKLGAIIERCNKRFQLGLNPAWLAQVKMYFRSLAASDDLERGWGSRTRTEEHICNTHDRNIMVDHYGTARLCFSGDFRGTRLEKVGDLRAFWEGADDIRREMQGCNLFCGISHSVRRETSTLASRQATLPDPARSPNRLIALWQRIAAN